jgi:peptidoglycan/xylan/chitin deacetylase (PgdA/CDA1 family)
MEHARIRTAPIAWPHGAKVAVVWTIIFELFTDDPSPYSIEDAKKALYGGRRGIWRLLDQMDKHHLKASFLINGLAAEKFPEAVVEVKKRGHEIVGYGYTTSRYLSEMKPADEKAEILKTLEILERVTGSKPEGWVSPDLLIGDGTLQVLVDAGMKWNGDFPNDDLPYVVPVGGKKMVILPNSIDCDDREIYGKNLQPPDVFTETFKDSLDVLLREGETHPKMLHATIRCQYFGRAVGTKAVDKSIQYAKSLPRVWFATRSEIAEWWTQQKYS